MPFRSSRLLSYLLPSSDVPKELRAGNLDALEACWAPLFKERGLHWEMHIEQHERDLWRVEGLDAPSPGSEEEKLWVRENRAVPYK